MNQLIHKIWHLGEAACIFMVISWQPFFGSISAIIASCYYIALFKMNVVNKNHEGSWRKYFNNVFKNIINKKT